MNEMEEQKRHLETLINIIEIKQGFYELWIVAAALFLGFFAQKWIADSHLIAGFAVLAGGVTSYFHHGSRVKSLQRVLQRLEDRISHYD